MRRVLIIVAIVLLPIIPLVLLVTGVIKKKPVTVPPVQLTVWGTEDEATAFSGVITGYRQTHPYVHVDYLKVRPEDYQQQLVNAWAQGQGPDVFFVPHTWIGKMKQFSLPEPADLGVPQVIQKKSFIGPSSQVTTVPQAAPTLLDLQNTYVESVIGDVFTDGQTWGLPLSLDTLVLYSNKDLLNNAKIFEPAHTWGELIEHVSSLTVADEHGGLVQSAVALGTANNVPYATDILTLLMMQNGSAMVGSDKVAHFRESPGLNALNFYTSFAQSKKTNYSWNTDQPNGLDAFLQGKVAYFFGTLHDREAIAASTLNWGVSPMLHLSSQGDNDPSGRVRFIDVAEYSVGMIAKAAAISGRSTQAWSFLSFMANSQHVTAYLQATNRLAAHKKILAAQKNDPIQGIFANQLLTTRSWYHGNDGPAVDGYLKDLITSVNNGKFSPQEALDLAADQVESTL